MTTRTDPLPLTLSDSRGFPWGRLVFSFVLTLTALALFVAAFAVGYTRLHDGKVVPGVEVGGVSLAGLDRPAAEAKLRESLPTLFSGQLTVRYGDVEEQIGYAQIGRDYDIALMLDQAFSVGREASIVDQVTEQLRVLMRGVSVEPSMTWNSEVLADHVAAVGVQALSDPVDATIVRQGGLYTVTPSVEGRTVDIEEGVRLANIAVNSLSGADTAIAVESTVVPPQVTTAQAQAAVDRLERVAATDLVLTGGDSSTTISADAIRGWLSLQEVGVGQWALAIEDAPIRQIVAQHAAEVDQPAQNATFRFQGDNVVAVAGQTGYAVDVAASSETALAALEARAAGTGSGGSNVNLAISVVEPDFTTEEARALAARVEQLGEWTTKYTPGPLNYGGKNITIPTEAVDGTVLEPGDTFDFLSVIGDITPENGYGPGAAIIRGRTRENGALGGGMCSCSTTVFNAALHAGLEMGARRNHFYYIARYPVGLDATVWISSSQRQTVSFTNDLQHAVLIRGINAPGKVTFQIWGVPDGRTVEVSEAQVTDKEQGSEKIQYRDDLAPGERKRVEWPVTGFKSTVVRTVRDANGNVIHKDTFFSNYRTIDGIIQVGRRPGDPAHGTLVPARGGGGSDSSADE